MGLYWYKDSDIGQNIQEIIKQLNIKSTYGYFSEEYPCGCYIQEMNHLYGMTKNKESVYLLVSTRSQLNQALFLGSLGFTDPEIRTIMESTHVD